MLYGERIFLRGVEESDIEYKVSWINDIEIRNVALIDYPVSKISTKNWLNRVSLDNDRKDFTICLSTNNLPIGYTGIKCIDYKNSKAEAFMVIGEKKYWSNGYGTEARKVLLMFAFKELGLNKIYTFNWTENKKIISLNKKFGFEIEGTLKEDFFSQGQYRDRVIMGLTKKNYFNFLKE